MRLAHVYFCNFICVQTFLATRTRIYIYQVLRKALCQVYKSIVHVLSLENGDFERVGGEVNRKTVKPSDVTSDLKAQEV